MKTKDFLKKHDACIDGAKWALSISDDMSDVWNAMVEQGKYNWLLWTATRPGVFPYAVLRKLACRFVRETPLSDGRTVWDLLTDERSRKAVEVADRYADGKATEQELDDARVAARAAHAAARAATAADYAAASAAYAAARAAYGATYAAAACVADYAVYADAYAAGDVAYATARTAAYAAAARDAAYAADAAEDAAHAAAKVAHVQMIAELGNTFKERTGR